MSYAQVPHRYEQPLPCAAGSVRFSRMHQHGLSAQSCSECHFARPEGNFALVSSELDVSCRGKVSKEAIGIALPVASTPLTGAEREPAGRTCCTGLVGT